LLFAKSTVGWGDIITGLPLPQRVANTAEGLSFWMRRKWSIENLVGLYDPGNRHLALGFKPGL
jgi:hypothetical protein